MRSNPTRSLKGSFSTGMILSRAFRFPILACLCISLFLSSVARAAGNEGVIVVKVGTEAAQTLLGFGTSLITEMEALPDGVAPDFSKRVFGDLKMNVVRLWAPSGEKETVETMLATFVRRYVESGRLELARQQGVTMHLLAPARGEEAPTEPMAEYGRKLAEFILQLKTRHQITIHVTGLANEPEQFSPKQVVDGIKALRTELDQRGLRDVGIVAPERANNDRAALEMIDAICAEPVALKSARGLSTHSYSMAANTPIASAITAVKKEFWITEAGNTGHEEPGDTQRAASLAARFLNDLNHRVTHWLHFIAYGDSGNLSLDKDNATKLLVFDRKTGTAFESLQYPYLRMLRVAFPTGCKVYPVTAEPGGDLLNSHGQKPRLNAAASRLPDGRWSFAVVNLTGLTNTPTATYDTAATLQVKLQLPAAESRLNKSFHRWRSNSEKKIVDEGRKSYSNGQIPCDLRPQELMIFLEEK